MVINLLIFIISLYAITKGSTMATKYSVKLAENFRISKFLVGFMIVAIISILPETFVAINASLENIPSFGLGTLFGSNVADLTLVFAVVVFLTGKKLKVEGKILKNNIVYPFILLLPLILGLNGHYSRLEGLTLIVAGGIFYYFALRNGTNHSAVVHNGHNGKSKNFLLLLFSMAILLVGSHFTVTSAVGIANYFNINPVLIGMFVVGLGTTIPELLFSLKSVKKHDDSLAVGDILGTVLADATIVVGILALINPFSFPQKIIYITGMFMVGASFMLFKFLKTGRTLSKKEACLLIIYWLLFVVVEFTVNR